MGELEADGFGTWPVFQCDECIVKTKWMGADVELALTFCVNAAGEPFDPATVDGKLLI